MSIAQVNQMRNAASDNEIRAALETYFRILQSSPTGEEMLRTIVTDDFETGFRDGYRWRGPNGLRDFLAARAGFARFSDLNENAKWLFATSDEALNR